MSQDVFIRKVLKLGKTHAPGDGTTAQNLSQYLGTEHWFDDEQLTNGVLTKRSNRRKKMRLVLNNTTDVTFYKSQLVAVDAGSKTSIQAFGATTDQVYVAPVDDQVPSAGVQPGYAFWVCLEGPNNGKTGNATDNPNVSFVAGDQVRTLVAAAGTESSTAGRITKHLLNELTAGTTTTLSLALLNRARSALGTILTAADSTLDDTEVLVDWSIRWF